MASTVAVAFTEQEMKMALEDRKMLQAIAEARKRRKIDNLFPLTGPYRRELYQKHVGFFEAGGYHVPQEHCPIGCDGTPHRERSLLAGNRTGKTTAASFECTLHLTGQYPDWWAGARFIDPILCWVANDSNKIVRDVNQLELLGPPGQLGTGMIPSDSIISTTPKPGIPDAVESVRIRHQPTGGISYLTFKSYEQGWEAFTGSAVHVVWCDEEPSLRVYTECCIRTMTTHGLVMLTLTPLQGTTEVIKGYLDAYVEHNDEHNIDTQVVNEN